jgi:hypothetical protein
MGATKPLFDIAWAAARRIYDPANPGAKVAKVIGGMVAYNITTIPPPYRWENTCAVRMSYILNQSGILIPHVPGKTVSGSDNRWYFHYVKDVIIFLNQIWGKPDIIISYPLSGGDTELSGKKGMILFEVSGWGDARGHATLWNGVLCYDHCYFNEPSAAYRTDRANFWRLK